MSSHNFNPHPLGIATVEALIKIVISSSLPKSFVSTHASALIHRKMLLATIAIMNNHNFVAFGEPVTSH